MPWPRDLLARSLLLLPGGFQERAGNSFTRILLLLVPDNFFSPRVPSGHARPRQFRRFLVPHCDVQLRVHSSSIYSHHVPILSSYRYSVLFPSTFFFFLFPRRASTLHRSKTKVLKKFLFVPIHFFFSLFLFFFLKRLRFHRDVDNCCTMKTLGRN